MAPLKWAMSTTEHEQYTWRFICQYIMLGNKSNSNMTPCFKTSSESSINNFMQVYHWTLI